MKTRFFSSPRVVATAAVAFMVSAPCLALWAGPTNSAAGVVVQYPFAEPPVPKSVFVIPNGPAEGKDPFFPKSSRPYGTVPTTQVSVPVPVVTELILRGISGTSENPLAIINTTTFSLGEENDVGSKAGKMRIRCLEINMAAGTVVVQIGGERRVLRLPQSK